VSRRLPRLHGRAPSWAQPRLLRVGAAPLAGRARPGGGGGGGIRVSHAAGRDRHHCRGREGRGGCSCAGGGEDPGQAGDAGREGLEEALTGGGRDGAEGSCGVGGAVGEEAAAGAAVAHREERAGGGGAAAGVVVLVCVDGAKGESDLAGGRGRGEARRAGRGWKDGSGLGHGVESWGGGVFVGVGV
jgi:hypothetical protein